MSFDTGENSISDSQYQIQSILYLILTSKYKHGFFKTTSYVTKYDQPDAVYSV